MTVKKISVDFPEDLYKSVKVLSALNDFSIRKFIVDAVKEKMSHTKVSGDLNSTTKKMIAQAIKDKKSNKLKKYNNFQEILDDTK